MWTLELFLIYVHQCAGNAKKQTREALLIRTTCTAVDPIQEALAHDATQQIANLRLDGLLACACILIAMKVLLLRPIFDIVLWTVVACLSGQYGLRWSKQLR